MTARKLIITIDGPAGSGKSTTARRVAEILGYHYLDSGALYRAVTLAVLRRGVDPKDQSAVPMVAQQCRIRLQTDERGTRVWLDEEDVSEAIRLPEVAHHIGPVAGNPELRRVLLQRQRELARLGGVVAEGRDMGTVVFPDAELKFFMIASIDERARRRQTDLAKLGHSMDLDSIRETIQRRDEDDRSRDASPLRKPDGAVEIDTTRLTIGQQVRLIVNAAVKAGAMVK